MVWFLILHKGLTFIHAAQWLFVLLIGSAWTGRERMVLKPQMSINGGGLKRHKMTIVTSLESHPSRPRRWSADQCETAMGCYWGVTSSWHPPAAVTDYKLFPWSLKTVSSVRPGPFLEAPWLISHGFLCHWCRRILQWRNSFLFYSYFLIALLLEKLSMHLFNGLTFNYR